MFVHFLFVVDVFLLFILNFSQLLLIFNLLDLLIFLLFFPLLLLFIQNFLFFFLLIRQFPQIVFLFLDLPIFEHFVHFGFLFFPSLFPLFIFFPFFVLLSLLLKLFVVLAELFLAVVDFDFLPFPFFLKLNFCFSLVPYFHLFNQGLLVILMERDLEFGRGWPLHDLLVLHDVISFLDADSEFLLSPHFVVLQLQLPSLLVLSQIRIQFFQLLQVSLN